MLRAAEVFRSQLCLDLGRNNRVLDESHGFGTVRVRAAA
jgi:hypothetical protein